MYRILDMSGILSRRRKRLPETSADMIPSIRVIPIITAAPIYLALSMSLYL